MYVHPDGWMQPINNSPSCQFSTPPSSPNTFTFGLVMLTIWQRPTRGFKMGVKTPMGIIYGHLLYSKYKNSSDVKALPLPSSWWWWRGQRQITSTTSPSSSAQWWRRPSSGTHVIIIPSGGRHGPAATNGRHALKTATNTNGEATDGSSAPLFK